MIDSVETAAMVVGLYVLGVGVGYIIHPFVDPPLPSQLPYFREKERVLMAVFAWWILVPTALAFLFVYLIAGIILGGIYMIAWFSERVFG